MISSYLARVAAAVAVTLRPISRKEVERRDRMNEAAASFPNDTCGHVRMRRHESPTPTHTVEERRQLLKAAYEKGPTPNVFHRKLRRGRTERKRIVGVRVYGKTYAFNGPIDRAECLIGGADPCVDVQA